MQLGGSLRRHRKQTRSVWSIDGLRRLFSSRRGKMLWIGSALAFGGMAIGYQFATRVMFPPPPPPGDLFVVPDLRGSAPEMAAMDILNAGLVSGAVDLVRHPLADSGTIIAQAPLPGQLLRPGKAVRVTVSMGPERRAIPDVVGLRETWAFNLLESAGFAVTRDSAEAPEVRGTVVALDPAAGTELALPGEITVTVSLGPPLVAMPRVLGMSEAEARDTLEALGLTVLEVEEVFRFGRSRGIVVEQAPPADSLLEVGSEVRLSVGRGRGRQELEKRNKKPLQP